MEPYRLEDSRARYDEWTTKLNKHKLSPKEFLVPQIEVPIPNVPLPPLGTGPELPAEDANQLKQRVNALKPWGYSFEISPGIFTGQPDYAHYQTYRTRLILGGIEKAMGGLNGKTVLDMACNHGMFTILACTQGAASGLGVDLRPENVAKANLLKEHFGVENAAFRQENVYRVEGEYDIVLNLGLLYHVVNPHRLMQRTFDLCKEMAVVDTITHRSPVSAFIQRTNKDVSKHAEGEFTVEFHPTYRALLDLMLAVGFHTLFEVVPQKDKKRAEHPLYETCQRRCIIGLKG